MKDGREASPVPCLLQCGAGILFFAGRPGRFFVVFFVADNERGRFFFLERKNAVCHRFFRLGCE